MSKRRVGILTGGGDCPGLNAVIRGVTKSAIHQHGMEVIGFYDGFLGLMERRFVELTSEKVSGILTQGGTILGTSNKAQPFSHPVEENGLKRTADVSDRCMDLYRQLGLHALICVGGDGTMAIGRRFSEKGANIVGVPKTIDNDVVGTEQTFGFDSARTMAAEAVDRLHTTADAHHRVMLVEVMGRNAGWLALESAIAGGGDIVLIPEIPYEIDELFAAISRREQSGKRFSIIVVAEGARPSGGEQTYFTGHSGAGEKPRLGGCSHLIAEEIERLVEIETRVTVLGHLQRGGAPTPFDRLLATQFAVKAMELVAAGQFNRMVTFNQNKIGSTPIETVSGQRTVPRDCPLIRAALAVGTNFGAKL